MVFSVGCRVGWDRSGGKQIAAMQRDAELQRAGDPLGALDEERRRIGRADGSRRLAEEREPVKKVRLRDVGQGGMGRNGLALVAPRHHRDR